jgi:hypothetical protein
MELSMADSVDHNGEMLSKNIALSIANEIGLEVNEAIIDPLADACHRFLEAGLAETLIHDVLSELLSELQRSGSLNTAFEESEFEDEVEPKLYGSTLFASRDDDDY